ncbi:hypothetical protein WN67_03340 [Mycolicibacterium obuense]|uniref:Uncharacterized protein n=1 Tax=Mycolicibacterium obuense TaxID=1807 RepID=A0A0M2K890_9MYCO|nr:hypothetical protein WN67_03340 [Mycolicibacterium obuense]
MIVMVVDVFCTGSVVIGGGLPSGRCRGWFRMAVMVVSLLCTRSVVMSPCFRAGWGVVAVP